jgi:protoporphyrin/coproporphyrin ferrochelatase
MQASDKTHAVILLNLGTPEAPSIQSTKTYLDEFLMDGDVLTIPKWLRWILVKGFILPFRSPRSAAKYKKVWLPEGSPLRYLHDRLVHKVRKQFEESETLVLGAMRYGHPSLTMALGQCLHLKHIHLYPLYPQYADATTGSTLKEAKRILSTLNWKGNLKVLPAFWEDPSFIQLFVAPLAKALERAPANTKVLLSYHGLPEQALKRAPQGKHVCLKKKDCCEAHRPFCYRAQCLDTSKRIQSGLQALGFKGAVETSFQSRLGPNRWLQPDTTSVLRQYAKAGQAVVAATPSFMTDCLETLEELDIEGREDYLSSGGTHWERVACPNSTDETVAFLCKLIEDHRKKAPLFLESGFF